MLWGFYNNRQTVNAINRKFILHVSSINNEKKAKKLLKRKVIVQRISQLTDDEGSGKSWKSSRSKTRSLLLCILAITKGFLTLIFILFMTQEKLFHFLRCLLLVGFSGLVILTLVFTVFHAHVDSLTNSLSSRFLHDYAKLWELSWIP